MNRGIHIRASLAVLLIDDFTGKIITAPSVKVYTESGKRPVRKQEGFWVFTNLTEETVKIRIEDSCYYKEERFVSLKELDSLEPVIRIRLKPNCLCRLAEKTGEVFVTLPRETSFWVFQKQGTHYKKLLSDYEKGSGEISLYQNQMEELEGKRCCIMDKNGEKELFYLGRLSDREKGIYQLDKPLQREYFKIGTKVFLLSGVETVSSREYVIPLRGAETDAYTCIFERAGKQKEEELVFKAGVLNHVLWQEP